jgi:hypothetical protein
MRTKEYAVLNFTRRGWFSKEKDAFKVDGHVYTASPQTYTQKEKEKNLADFPVKGGTPVYHIFGKWNESVTTEDVNSGASECAWRKNIYPEKHTHMYGMSHF